MQSLLSWLFFIAFALVLVGMYRAIRRRWAAPGIVALVGGILSIAAMMLMALAQGDGLMQAVVVGIGVGGGFSIVMLMLAWYFLGEEEQRLNTEEAREERGSSNGETEEEEEENRVES
jgi:Na+-translocating ferredoxin:NAD+ oxidoreductase RnfA subunit